METPEFTYNGLLALIHRSGTQFRMMAFGICKTTAYLQNEHKDPKNDDFYRIIENAMGKELILTFSGNEIMKMIEEEAKMDSLTFDQVNFELHQLLIRSTIQKSLIMTYEFINNYKSLNNPGMMRELSKHDWFRMLRILRDHFTHFYNLGKRIEFPNGQPYKSLSEVSWNGLTIKRGQLGESVNVSIKYTMDLIDHCFNHLRDNRATLA